MKNQWDVVVLGGGPAGLVAAIAAARNDAKTLLIERYGFLGGMSTAALVAPWMTFHSKDGGQVIRGIPQELVGRLMEAGGSPGHLPDTMGETSTVTPVDPEVLKYVAQEMVLEAGAEILYHSFALQTFLAGSNLVGVAVASKSGSQNIEAGFFVDATGDADIAALAGVPCEKGRAEDGAMQPVSLIFRMANVDLAQVEAYMGSHPEEFHHRTHFDQLGRIPLVSVSGFFSIWRGAVGRGEIDIPRERILFFRGARSDVVTVNTTRILGIDGTSTSDLTRAEIEGRRQAWTVSRFLQKNIPGFEKTFLMDTGVQIGVRETRRIMGEYTLTQEDILEGRTFPDDVARGAYSIDIHDVKGSSFVQLEAPEYGIPYRCLVPKKVENLLVAGRSISTTREAQASIRVTPTCMATGQAAGTAAAVSAMEGIKPRQISGERLHEMLKNQGVHF